MYNFCIPWLLTWFAHSITNLEKVCRIYDYLLSSDAYSIIYVCAGFILGTKELLLEQIKEETEEAGVFIYVIFLIYKNHIVRDDFYILSKYQKLII